MLKRPLAMQRAYALSLDAVHASDLLGAEAVAVNV
jgi:hypothetical protein